MLEYKKQGENKMNKYKMKRIISNIATIFLFILIITIFLNNNETTRDNLENETKKTIENINDIPEYAGEICIDLNNNIPYFADSELTQEVFENYSKLDELGRCGVAYANICKELMPKNEDTRIRLTYKPTGWHQKVYNNGEVLYNRCHLIAWQLGNENENICNLITGTSSLNAAMNEWEILVGNWIRNEARKGNNYHVLYRITPDFRGDNLVANGVEIEAKSVEDNGKGICFNKYIYNVQEGFEIDYATGFSFPKE